MYGEGWELPLSMGEEGVSAFTINTSWIPKCAKKNDSAAEAVLMWQYAVLEINVLLWAAFFFVTWVLSKRLVSLGLLWIKASRLPGPPASHFAKHANCENLTEYFRALHKAYGPVVRVWLGPTRALVSLKDRKLAEEMLLRAKDRERRTCKAVEHAFGKGSLCTASYSQVKQKRFYLYEHLTGKLVESVHPISVKVAFQVKDWAQPGKDGWAVDSRRVAQHMAFASLCVFLFGESFFVWPGAQEFESAMEETSSQTCLWAKYNVVPFWSREYWKYRKMCGRLQALAEDIIGLSRQQRMQRNGDVNQRVCYLDEVDAIVASGGDKNVPFIKDLVCRTADSSVCVMPPDEVRGHVMAVLYHGLRTVGTVMNGLLTRLAHDPDVQAKVHAEIEGICKGNVPTAANIREMHYLKAAVYESSRLTPGGPVVSRCSSDRDLQLGNTVLPAGAILSVPVEVLQTDIQESGQDASEFRPERFLTVPAVQSSNQSESGSGSTALPNENLGLESGRPAFQKPGSSLLYMTYGSGPRCCVGQDAATQQMMTLISCILQQFTVQPGNDVEQKLTPSSNLTPSGLLLIPRE